MRLRLLLVLCLAAIVVKQADSSFIGSKWTNVFKSFFGPKDKVVPVNDSPLDEKDARVKRSIFASLGAQINCEPGYTGQFCESPICFYPGQLQPVNSNQYKKIDEFSLRQGCSGNVTFPLDSDSRNLVIQVNMDTGNPNLILINDKGIVLIPTIANGNIYLWRLPPPGQYALKVASDSPNTIFCDVTIETETELTAAVGFVRRPTEDAFEPGLAYNIPQYLIAHPYSLVAPGTINAIYIYENSRDHTRYLARLQPRYGCAYEYYAGEFTCDPQAISYRWVVEGVDNNGYLWRRTDSFACAQAPTSPPPPTTPPSNTTGPTFCQNNGILLTQSNGQTVCYCREFFTGDTCQYALCMNGGTPTMGSDVCMCPAGYSGLYCQDIQCIEQFPDSYYTEKKSLVVVIRQSQAIINQLPNIIQAINLTRNGYYGSTDVFSNYIITTFGDNDVLQHEYGPDEYNSFLIALSVLPVRTHACRDSDVAALANVFAQALVLYHKSPIFLFTDVAADDSANYLDVISPNAYRKLPIYTFFLTDNSTECYNQTDPNSRGYRTVQDISLLSGGLLFTPSNANYAYAFQQTIIRTTYHANYITMNEMVKCNMANRASFIVDRSANSISILATGSNLVLTVTDPAWNVLNSSQLISVVSDGRNYIWDFVDNLPGEYLYFIQATGGGTNAPCFFRVVSQSLPDSPVYDMWVGASLRLLEDMTLPDPVNGISSHMVVHFNGFGGREIDPFRLFAEIQINTWDYNLMANVPVYYSSGIWRDGCSFHLYFGGFICNQPEQRYLVNVFADDEFGFPIQRSWTSYCAPSVYPTQPPNGQCYNGGAPSPYNSSVCICTPHWTGPTCTTIKCENNGTSNGDYCTCASLTIGQYCEYLVCNGANQGVYFGNNDRGLAFVINVRNTMTSTIQDIANQALPLVRDLINADGFRYISYYTLIWFNQLGAQKVLTVPSYQFERFIQGIQSLVAISQNQPIADPNNCTGQISMGVLLAVNDFGTNNLPNSYVYVFTDSDFSNDTTAYYGALFAAQDVKAAVNFVVTNYSLCGAPNPNQGPSDWMRYLVRDTAGMIYYTKNAGRLLQVIPTFHRSGLVAGGETMTCNSGINYAVPVDAWSQSFIVTVTGHGAQITVTPPSTAQNVAYYYNQIDQDDYLNVVQYIIPCEGPSWSPHGQFCYIVQNTYGNYTWNRARDSCHNLDESFLFNVLTSDDQAWLEQQFGQTSSWIGLYRFPGTNTFQWDSPRFSNLTLVNGSYTNWATGEPSAAGSGKDCVVAKKDGTGLKWFTTSCNDTGYQFECQKHKYGQTIQPRDPDQNRLPAGIWQLQIKSNYSEPCFFEVRIQSEIQVFWGYTLDIHSDYPVNWGELQSTGNEIAAHTNGLEPLDANNVIDKTDGHLNYALIYGADRQLYATATFQDRRYCSYTSISQNFACPGYGNTTAKSSFFIKFSGIDQFGNLFERFASTYCTATAHCTHGYLYNGVCNCEQYWEGQSCNTPSCLNGGQLANGQCQCPSDFGGPNCQYARCQDTQRITFNDTGITLAILLETSSSTGSALFYLRNNLAKIIGNVILNNVTSTQWIANYILYPFDSASNEQFWYPPVVSNTFDAINASINNITTFNGCPSANGASGQCASGTNCPRPIMRVLNNTLNMQQFKGQNSIVLIITASNVMDYPLLQEVHDNAQAKRTTVNVIIVDKAAPCGNFSYRSPETTALYLIAQMTGGDFFYSTGKSVVANLLPYYLPTLYRTAHLGTIIVRNCSDETIYFPIDSGTQSFTVSYTGASSRTISLTITDANRTIVPLPDGYALYDYTYFASFDYKNQLTNPPGTWKLEVKAAAETCVLTVRLRSTIEVFAGFTDETNAVLHGATKDSPIYPLPESNNVQNGIVLHANNLGNGTLNYVQIYGTRGDAVLFSSELLYRVGCNYEWWAPSSWQCDFGVYVLSVSGIDQNGQNFLRNIPVQCVFTRPPPPPPQPRCDTTELTYDIALLLDVSMKSVAYGATVWADFTYALSRALGAYYPAGGKFSSTGTQVAIISVAGNASGNTKLINSFADSNGKTSADLLINVVQQNDYGQNLPSAISILQQLVNSPTSGYRNPTQNPNVRHLAIYATINAGQTEGGDPANDVHSLVRSGTFGFSVVGYNNTYYDPGYKANLESLTSFPCLYFAIDNPIGIYIPNYINDLTCMRFPMCGDASQNDGGMKKLLLN